MTLYSRTLNRRRRYLLRPRPDSTIDETGSSLPPYKTDVADDFVFDDGVATTVAEADFEQASAPSVPVSDGQAAPFAASDLSEPQAAHPHVEPLELVLTSPDGTGLEPVRIDEATCLVGSGSQADLRLPHPDVSRNHALLHRAGDRLLFGDLGSRTGISRNGERCDCGWLEPGDVLQVGPYSLHWHGHFTGDDAASAQALQTPTDDQPTPAPTTSRRRLRVTEGQIGFGSEIALDRPMTLIGRGPACGLRLRDKSVARAHAAILSLENDVFAVDLARRGEPLVNDRPEPCLRLHAGDELRIGPYRIALLDAGSSSMDAGKPDVPPEPVREPFPETAAADEAKHADLAAALADLQRRFHERSCRQLELLGRVVESVEGGLKDDVLKEVEQLRQIVGEHENGSPLHPPQPANPEAAAPEAAAKERRARSVRRAFGGRTTAKPQDRPTAAPHRPVTPPSLPEPTAAAEALAVDYGRIAQRIAVHQQRTQPGGWARLLRLLF
ncbi:MAG: FHA domain-containing protein [Planctomycetaceae bacterium]